MLLPLGVILLGIIAVPTAFAETTYEEHIIEPVTTFGYSGCQDKDGCYNPVTTHAEHGDVVIFNNTDFAAHTFTSGTPDDGPSGVFDSGLKLPRYSFQWQADTAGEIPYFCTVHNWMTGVIIVEGDQPMPETPEVDSEELQQVLDHLTGLITNLQTQIEALEDRITILETALEAGNSESEAVIVDGYVYFDSNVNGMFDDDESGLEDMAVVVSDITTGDIVSILQTDSLGYYFLLLDPGSYLFSVGGTDLSMAITFGEVQNVRHDLGLDRIPETETEPEPETPESTWPDVFITTDKTAYSLGDTIHLSGFIDRSILDAQYSDERLGYTITGYNIQSISFQTGGIADCYRPYDQVLNDYPNLEHDELYVAPRSNDGVNFLYEQARKCFDNEGNFNFEFEVKEDWRAGSYDIRIIVYVSQDSPVDYVSAAPWNSRAYVFMLSDVFTVG